MFTGLVQKIAKVTSVKRDNGGVRLVISCTEWADSIELGESISTSGCCLTVVGNVVENGNNLISFDIVQESLICTTLDSLQEGSSVNVERSLRPDSFLGGHFVQGHINGIETVSLVTPHDSGDCRLRITMATIDSDTIIPKGSVSIDGVSLTVATVCDDWFEVALVPTTLRETTLGTIQVGDSVNIETDILTRTIVEVVRKMQQ